MFRHHSIKLLSFLALQFSIVCFGEEVASVKIPKSVQDPLSGTELPPSSGISAANEPLVLCGSGYVRGEKTLTLNTKYANFVTKINAASQQKIRKGEVILTYDDLSLRQQIQAKENNIRLLEIQILTKQQEHEAKKLDPLPAEYKNLELKKKSAMERYNKVKHELDVYSQLAKVKSVPELTYLEKQQEFIAAEAELKQVQNSITVVKKGLDKINIKISEYELEKLRCQLENAKLELELLKETRKYYEIVSPVDGICMIVAGPVGAYSKEGGAAAVIHYGSGKVIYAKFGADAVSRMEPGMECEFRSSSYDPQEAVFKVKVKSISKNFENEDGRHIYSVSFAVITEPKPLAIDSTGTVMFRLE